jgi:membrane fusion protein (multidrug efflux system)
VSVEGPIVLVRARIPSPTFVSDGQVFSYVDGLPGRAEVLIRSEPILVSFIPGLRRFLSHGG